MLVSQDILVTYGMNINRDLAFVKPGLTSPYAKALCQHCFKVAPSWAFHHPRWLRFIEIQTNTLFSIIVVSLHHSTGETQGWLLFWSSVRKTQCKCLYRIGHRHFLIILIVGVWQTLFSVVILTKKLLKQYQISGCQTTPAVADSKQGHCQINQAGNHKGLYVGLNFHNLISEIKPVAKYY